MGRDNSKEIQIGQVINGPKMEVTREVIKQFAEASLDFNALHLDEQFMEKSFGKTQFDDVIAHGMMTFSLMTRMMTDWLWPRGKIHRRLETRWRTPVYPGDTLTCKATVTQKLKTQKGQWIIFSLEVKNQKGDLVATGESMAESQDGMC